MITRQAYQLTRVWIDKKLSCQCRVESLRLPVVCAQVFLTIVSKQTEAYPQIKRQSLAQLPIVLHEWFGDPVAVVVPQLRAILRIATDRVAAPEKSRLPFVVEKVGEGVSCTETASVHVAEVQQALHVTRRRSQRSIGLVLLRAHIL